MVENVGSRTRWLSTLVPATGGWYPCARPDLKNRALFTALCGVDSRVVKPLNHVTLQPNMRDDIPDKMLDIMVHLSGCKVTRQARDGI